MYLLISDLRQKRAEREEHISNAVLHVENGIRNITEATEVIITYNVIMNQAETSAGISEYEAAISIYEAAIRVAATINYTHGVTLAESGIDEMHELIIAAKREEAMNLFFTGDQLYKDGMYEEALEPLIKALEIYVELNDQQNIILTKARIDYSEMKLAEMEQSNPEQLPAEDEQDDEHDDETEDKIEPSLNYEHNLGINFDMRTLIDNQNQSPANRVRMGMRDGLNEGWYNGCGWVAVYNALIILENPKHPADIVKFFEESGGIAFGGVFGTYPNSIEEYLRSFGYRVNHTLFPQVSTNIDDVIKNSNVSILAYLHTGAAHYITVVYNEDINKFIIYNDSFARNMSANLGYQNYTDTGAAIDSVAALINSTREILFSFSLITINE